MPGTREDAEGREINTTVCFRTSQMHNQKQKYFVFYSIAGEAEGGNIVKIGLLEGSS